MKLSGVVSAEGSRAQAAEVRRAVFCSWRRRSPLMRPGGKRTPGFLFPVAGRVWKSELSHGSASRRIQAIFSCSRQTLDDMCRWHRASQMLRARWPSPGVAEPAAADPSDGNKVGSSPRCQIAPVCLR